MKSMDNEAIIRMVETNLGRWELQTRHGYVLKDNLHLGTAAEAESYVKAYLSSWLCWDYEIVPMKKELK